MKIHNNTLINANAPNYSSGITTKNIQKAQISGNQIFKTEIPKGPLAAFSASPVSGYAPLTVKFTDQSTNSPAAWNWNFGDGNKSTLQNPIHTYSTAGNYTVVLTATNAAGGNTATGTAYVKSPEESVSEESVSEETAITRIKGDNRLREAFPDIVYQDSPFIDVRGMSTGKYRDIMQFDLSEYTSDSQVSNAALSLYWYYPGGKTRPSDTVIEIYRPASSWNPDYANWNRKDSNIA